MRYRKDIDGLRALAIILVIFFHTFPQLLPNGFLGVDIFFVISGYLIHSYILSQVKMNTFSAINFFSRRIKRILPVSLVVLIFTAVVGMLTLFDNEFLNLKNHIRAVAGFYMNYKLIDEVGYFDTISYLKPLLHFWSLAVEEQFYIVWPPLIYSLSYLQKLNSKINKIFIVTLALLLFSSLIYFFSLDLRIYYSPFARAWQILAGAILAQAENDFSISQKIKNSHSLMILSFSFLIIALIPNINEISSLFAVIGAILFILVSPQHKLKFFFKTSPVVFIGLISYSLYLWHWPLLSFTRLYSSIQLDYVAGVVLIFVAILMSIATYYLIEKPLKYKNWDIFFTNRTRSEKLNITFRIISILMAFVLSFLFSSYLPKLSIDSKLTETKKNLNSFPVEDESAIKCLLSAEERALYQIGWCFSSKIDKQNLPNGVVFGDSHAHSLFSGLVNEIKEIHWELVAASSCPPYLLNNTKKQGCNDAMIKIYERLESSEEIQYVVFEIAHETFLENIENFYNYESQIFENIDKIRKSGKKIIIMEPVPEITHNIMACIQKRPYFLQTLLNYSANCRISTNKWNSISAEDKVFFNKLRKRFPDVIMINAQEAICNNDSCDVLKNDEVLYMDYQHLTPFGAGLVAKLIKKSL